MDHELGIIEGFYGRPYSLEIRDYLIKRASLGYSYYVYAPKNDPALRRQWQRSFSSAEEKLLLHINESCKSAKIKFSLGISPINISNEGHGALKALKDKIKAIYSIVNPGLFCLLFDDIIAECADLGKKQNEAIFTVLDCLPHNTRLIICPSFYSFDPVLEKIFGKMPADYFNEIGAGLCSKNNVSFFWTGNKVLSTSSLSYDDMQRAQNITGLRLSIWDNYPVNDGRKICKRLYTSCFSGRQSLTKYAREYQKTNHTSFMHFVNPMCEGSLSTLALSSLPLIYKEAADDEIRQAFETELELLFGKHKDNILPYLNYFEENDLDTLDDESRQKLFTLLSKTRGAGVRDFLDFILGKYAFDPQCLTS